MDFNGFPVYRNLSLLFFIEAVEDIHQGRFTGAVFT